MLTAQAAGTQIKLFRFPVNHDCSGLDIGQPAPFGMLLRMAYLIAGVCCFAAEVAFCSQTINSFLQMRLFSYPSGIGAKQVTLDNRSRIIPQFADYTKEKR